MDAQLVEKVLRGEYPSLGDPEVVHQVEMTEPEICAFWSVVAFMRSFLALPNPVTDGWWKHYGPSLESFNKKLEIYSTDRDEETIQ